MSQVLSVPLFLPYVLLLCEVFSGMPF
jgi:hypothetical protein